MTGRVASGRIAVGQAVQLHVDAARRRAIRANHSATHLLHAALRIVLGGHVTQKGSLVAPDRLRFDFSHPKAVTADELAEIERLVNAEILANEAVETRLMTPDAAVEAGALALFGEKYGEEVRVLSMGRLGAESGRAWSVELCGGTHVRATGDIGLFRIVSESAVASGVRRIEAMTGEGALRHLIAAEERLKGVAAVLRAPAEEAPARAAALAEQVRRLERELTEAKRALAMAGPGQAPAGPEAVGAAGFIGQTLEGIEARDLRGLVDKAKARLGSGVVALVAVNDGRASVAVGVTPDLTATVSAVDLVRAAAAALGGQGGGGRPDMAQAGGPDGARAPDALAAVRAGLAAALGVAA
jgi:alanyl-tRNA synthetase